MRLVVTRFVVFVFVVVDFFGDEVGEVGDDKIDDDEVDEVGGDESG